MNATHRIHRALATLLVAVGLSAVTASPAGAGTANVVWPERTVFNPDLFDYVVTANYAGEGQLFYTWAPNGSDPVYRPMSSQGQTALQFPLDGDHEQVWVWVCTGPPAEGGTCQDSGDVSPSLNVHRALVVNTDTNVLSGQNKLEVSLSVWPGWTGTAHAVQATVKVIDASTGSAVATKAGSFAFDETNLVILDMTLPLTVPDGLYEVHVSATAETGDANYGSISGNSVEIGVYYAGPAPALTLTKAFPKFYPVVDGYRDTDSFTWKTTRPGLVTLVVRNSGGKIVRTLFSGQVSTLNKRVSVWNGRTSAGTLTREGTYYVHLKVDWGNSAPKSTWIAVIVSHKKLVTKTFTKTVTPQASLIRAEVGDCSKLRRPSLRGWAGSLGYYSNITCNGGETLKSIVLTNHKMFVPKAFGGRYASIRVSSYSGAAKGHVKGSYLVTLWYTASGDLTGRSQWGPELKTHVGVLTRAAQIVRDQTTRPFVIWGAGLTNGSRFDVKNFTVRLTYRVLQ